MTKFRRWRQMPILCAGTVLAGLLLAGCSRENDDWRAAQAADTVVAYQQFLHQYPGSAHATDANTRVGQLAEDEAWQQATRQDSLLAYQQFVNRYPEGKWAQEARVRVENFSIAAPSTQTPAAAAAAPGTSAGSPSPGAPAPAAAPAAAAPRSVAAAPAAGSVPQSGDSASGGYGVQLGAFSSRAKAQAQWLAVSARFKSELGGSRSHVSVGKSAAGEVFRLRVFTASEAKARELCARLKSGKQPCVVYRP